MSKHPSRDYDPAWSPDGKRIAYISERDGDAEIYIVDYQTRTSTRLMLLAGSNETAPAWSPDGNTIAVLSNMSGERDNDIYLMDINTQKITRLTTTQTRKRSLAWANNGQELIFSERRDVNEFHVVRMNVNTTTQLLVTNIGPRNMRPITSVDNTCVLFETNRMGIWQIWETRENGNFPRALTIEGSNAGDVSLSPDSSTILFASDRAESDEIFVIDAQMNCNLSAPENADDALESNLRRLTSNTVSDFSPVW